MFWIIQKGTVPWPLTVARIDVKVRQWNHEHFAAFQNSYLKKKLLANNSKRVLTPPRVMAHLFGISPVLLECRMSGTRLEGRRGSALVPPQFHHPPVHAQVNVQ